MEHKSLGVREERRALFLRVLPWKRKGERSELSVLFFGVCKRGEKGKGEALGKTSQLASTQLSNGHTPLFYL